MDRRAATDDRWDAEVRALISRVDDSMASGDSAKLDALREELKRARVTVNETGARIRTQIIEAKRDHATGLGSADRDWLRRAEWAARKSTILGQLVQNKLGQLNQAIKTARAAKAIGAKHRDEGAWQVDLNKVIRVWRDLGRILGQLPDDFVLSIDLSERAGESASDRPPSDYDNESPSDT